MTKAYQSIKWNQFFTRIYSRILNSLAQLGTRVKWYTKIRFWKSCCTSKKVKSLVTRVAHYSILWYDLLMIHDAPSKISFTFSSLSRLRVAFIKIGFIVALKMSFRREMSFLYMFCRCSQCAMAGPIKKDQSSRLHFNRGHPGITWSRFWAFLTPIRGGQFYKISLMLWNDNLANLPPPQMSTWFMDNLIWTSMHDEKGH